MFTVGVKLRPYSHQDFPLLSAVEGSCFPSPFRFSDETLQILAESESSFTWVAEYGDQIAGFAIVELETTSSVLYGYLQTIDVAPEYRRRGIAAKLLDRVETEIAQTGALVMRLHVSVQNQAAITMYEHHGYSRLRIVRGFYGSDGGNAFVYEKLLTVKPQINHEGG